MRVLFELSVAEIKELLAKNQQKMKEPVIPMMPTDKAAPVVSITSNEPKPPVFGGNHTEEQKRYFSEGLKYFKVAKNLSVSQFAKCFRPLSGIPVSNGLWKCAIPSSFPVSVPYRGFRFLTYSFAKKVFDTVTVPFPSPIGDSGF